MIRIRKANSSAKALEYYTSGLKHEDYLINELTEQGKWFGEGSSKLNLFGGVSRDDFAALARNVRSDTGEQLTVRTRANRRAGWDIGFSVPKSVSLLYALGDDPKVLIAYQRAVMSTMAIIEADAKTRVRVEGAAADRTTGNLVWAQFVHTTTRPVDGIPDPQLHAHCFLFNATYDPVEGKWKAVQIGEVYRDLPYYQAVYMSRLAEELHAAGYETERSGLFWEVKGVPGEEVRRFSRRTKEINEFIERNGIENEAEKAGVGARTRQSKKRAKLLTDSDLRDRWREAVDDEHRGFWDRAKGKFSGPRPKSDLRDAVSDALKDIFEFEAVVRERRLLGDVLGRVPGHFSEEEIRAESLRQGVILRQLDDGPWVTTRAIRDEELLMVERAQGLLGRVRPLSDRRLTEAEARVGGEALEALNRVLTSTDGVVIIDRRQASGQEGLLSHLSGILQRRNHDQGHHPLLGMPEMVALAPNARAASKLSTECGLPQAITVAEFLAKRTKQFAAFASGVVVMSDADKVGTRQMSEVLQWTTLTGSRLVLVGDTRFHRSSSRGDCLNVLREHGGIEPIVLAEVRRAHGPYRQAIQDMMKGDVGTAYDKLFDANAIRQRPKEDVVLAAADSFVQSRKSGQKVLAIAPSPDDGERLTHVIREQMRKEGWLGASRKFVQHRAAEGTLRERSEPSFYKRGQQVKFHQNCWGFKAGSNWEVLGRDPFQNVVVRSDDGKYKALPLGKAERFSVYDTEKIRVAVGDTIRITCGTRVFSAAESLLHHTFARPFKPGRAPSPIERVAAAGVNKVLKRFRYPTHKLNRDSVHVVKGFTPRGGILLDNNLVIPPEFGHIEHGYCWSPYRARDLRADKVVMLAPGTARAEHLYAAVSAARDEAAVYTTNPAELRASLVASRPAPSAMDMDRGQRSGDDSRANTQRSRNQEQHRGRDREDRGREPEMDRG